MRVRRLHAALVSAAAPVYALCSESWPSMKAGDGGVRYKSDGSLAGVSSTLNYQTAAVDKVVTRRDALGSDATLEGADWATEAVEVANGRGVLLTLERNGFELIRAPMTAVAGKDYYDQSSIVSHYFPHCEAAVAEATGAAFVAAFDYNVRSSEGCRAGRRLAGGSQVQDPAPLVHGDYTHASAPRRVAMLAQPPKVNDVLREVLGERPLLPPQVAEEVASGRRRFAIVNVWRNITPHPVQRSPLACCDAATTEQDDLVTFEIHYGAASRGRPFPLHRHALLLPPEPPPPLRSRPRGRELLRQALAAPPLVLFPSHGRRRGDADQAVGLGRRPRATPQGGRRDAAFHVCAAQRLRRPDDHRGRARPREHRGALHRHLLICTRACCMRVLRILR